MKLSEVSIQRPVLATVMTLTLVLFGIIAFTRLPIREYPDIDAPIVSVRTVYPGASASVVETDVTALLEESLSGIESLKTLSSFSREEVSEITIEFDLARNLDDAANDVRDRIFSVRRLLPADCEEPVLWKASSDAVAIVWLSLQSNRHSELEITDFAERYIKDRLAALPGVSTVWIWGARRYAMRIWLDADRLGARRLTVQDVEEALRSQNVAIPSGRIESERLEFSVRTRGELYTPRQFNRLVVAYRDGYPIRLEDVGHAELGAEDDRKIVRLNGQPTISLGVVKQSKANTLAVARAVKEKFQEIQPSLPEGMTLRIAADSSKYIEQSLHEVYVAMGLALLLVMAVIFLFLGNMRATLIPAVAIPASIISAFTLMHAFGFSINVLTLLGLVLAIGLVVDDAIVVLENIHRRIESGQPPLRAAVEGTREIGFAVIATTISLVAVFVPIAFLTGAIARLFAELALAVAGSVLISGFIALTLTPMMSAKMLHADRSDQPGNGNGVRFNLSTHRVYADFLGLYRRLLTRALRARPLVIFIGVTSLAGGALLFASLQSELAPLEDSGSLMASMAAPEGATIRYTDYYTRQMESLFADVPEIESYTTWVASGIRPAIVTRGGSWINLKDWSQRKRSQQDILAELAPKLAQIPGLTTTLISPAPLNQWGNKSPVQFVIGGATYDELERLVGLMLDHARLNPGLTNLESNLNVNKPELQVHVDRDKAADLGVSVAEIGRTLETLLGGRQVTGFKREGRDYRVMVKIQDQDRVKPSDISSLYVRGHQGEPLQLANLVTIQETVAPRELNHYGKMRAATISAGLAPGYTLGDALDYLEATARKYLPSGTQIGYAGESKEFKEASGSLYTTFFLAFLVIYLVLAAQFESFLHPFTILLSVPPAVTGALMTLAVLGGTLNIYSQIGMIMLIGLVSKNAILIVDFANQLKARGKDLTSAVIEAAALRLRPILMTTLATILGAVPLVLATGAGSAGRRQIGDVIVGGMIFSTLLTLFIVPVVYTYLSRRAVTRQDGEAVGQGTEIIAHEAPFQVG